MIVTEDLITVFLLLLLLLVRALAMAMAMLVVAMLVPPFTRGVKLLHQCNSDPSILLGLVRPN